MIENYNVLKENNLRQMVAEYETTSNNVSEKRAKERKLCLHELETEGKSKSITYHEQNVIDTANANNDVKIYYHKVFEQMVKNYTIFDLAAQVYPSDRQHTVQKSRVRQITNKYQLRQIVNSFNSQHLK